MNEQQMLMRKLSSAQFAAWEIRIYLDTHPDDRSAMESFKKYNEQANALRKEYEKQYGPLIVSDQAMHTGDAWVRNPWPWELEA